MNAISKKLAISAAALASCLAANAAMAAPLALAAGASGTVPNYDGRTPTTTTVISAACGYDAGGPCTTGTTLAALETTAGLGLLFSPGGFLEVAATTALNPYGSNDVTLAFLLAGQDFNSDLISSVTVSSFAGWNTSVEACGPVFGGSNVSGCTVGSAGTATRSSAITDGGNALTFTNLAVIHVIPYAYSPAYIIYTNASTSNLGDPSNFVINFTNHTSMSFAGLGLVTPPPTSAPEIDPATAAAGLMLLFGGLLVLRGRQPAKRLTAAA